MKIAVFGAGAIGGYLAVKLHQAGADVCGHRARATSGRHARERPDPEK